MKPSTSTNGLSVVMLIIFLAAVAGCATVPMASKEQDAIAKTFALPASNKAGLYIFRNSFVGQALRKELYIDGILIGKTANKTYFYKEITPGNHTVSTESEFGKNDISFLAEGGKNYYARQYIKFGVIIGGSNLEMVGEEEGKKEILECELVQTQ